MKKIVIGSLAAVACSFVLSAAASADHHNNEWISMFNGRNLEGWKVNENKDSIGVDDGMMVIDGPIAHAFFIGSDGKANFKDFHFQAQVKTMKGANSGIYFHTKFQDSGWPSKGYECQVNVTHKDPKKSGSLYGVDNISADQLTGLIKDDEWYTTTIRVEDRKITIKLNGKTMVEHTEPEDKEAFSDGFERRLGTGTFALQAHDPKSIVQFRNLKVRRLP